MTLTKEDYRIDIDKGIDPIKSNDNIISDNMNIEDGNNYIKINRDLNKYKIYKGLLRN